MSTDLKCTMMAPPVLAITLILLAVFAKGSDFLPARKFRDIKQESGSHDQYRKFQPMTARACNILSLDVYREITPAHDNIVFSPFSLCSLLAVCTNGARGMTRRELKGKQNLKLTSKTELSKNYASIYRSFKDDEHVNITTSNILLINKNLQLVQKAKDDYRNSFNGFVQTFDPEMKETVPSVVNSLVSSATDGLVTGNLKADDVIADGTLIFSNTLRLSAKWQDKFEIAGTKPMRFYVNASSGVLTDTMNRRGQYRTIMNNNLKCDILEIPYKGDRFALYILLPFEKDGLNEMEELLANRFRLEIETIFEEVETSRSQIIDLYLPKFSISQSFSMKDALKANKIRTLFDHNKANLSGLVQGGKVFIKEVLQTSTIVVTEEGTVADTTADMQRLVLEHRSSFVSEFKADHPFLYVLRDRRTDFNVFMGKFSKP